MISTNDFRTGLTIDMDGEIFQVVEFQHVKPGKGSAFVRCKLKNFRTGGVVERTFRAGEKLARAHLDRREMQYLYREGDNLVFMDTESYEQMTLPEAQLGDSLRWLKDNMNIHIVVYQDAPVGIELPNFVELAVTETEPGVKGDTATGATKNATLETGAVVQVPLFVEVGDVVRVDTRTSQYLVRV